MKKNTTRSKDMKRIAAAQKQSNNYYSHPSSKTLTVILVIVLILGNSAWIGKLIYDNHHEKTMKLSRIETYLEEKYAQDFVVDNLRVENGGFAIEGTLVADAFPKSDPSLVFQYKKPEHRQVPVNYPYDSFLETLWSKQAREQFDDFIKKELPSIGSYELTVKPGFDFQSSIEGVTPTFSEVQQKHSDQLVYQLKVSSLTYSTETVPPEIELERAMKLVAFLKQQNFSSPELSYSYRYGDSPKSPQTSKGYYYRFSVDGRDELNAVVNLGDIRDRFRQ